MKFFLFIIFFFNVAYTQNIELEIKEISEHIKTQEIVWYQLNVINKESSIVENISVLYKIPNGAYYQNKIAKNETISWKIDKLLPKEEKILKYKLKFLKPGLHRSFANLLIGKQLICQTKIMNSLVVNQKNDIEIEIGREAHFQKLSYANYYINITNNSDFSVQNVYLEGTKNRNYKSANIT